MPELPEVETLRRSLEPLLLGRRIHRATLLRRDVLVLPGDPPGGWTRSRSSSNPPPVPPAALLEGEVVDVLLRRGKQLAIASKSGRTLLVHLGMTGSLRLTGDPTDTHVHARWLLDSGQTLLFRDPRRFGGLWALNSRNDLAARWAALGPDALSLDGPALRTRLTGSHRPIKAALLDQTCVAGVGNIYADEALFLAGIRPTRRASRLSRAEGDALAAAIGTVMHRALAAGGSTLRDYVNAVGSPGNAQAGHQVYGRAGLACLRCGGPLSDGLVAQRQTVWCRRCQK